MSRLILFVLFTLASVDSLGVEIVKGTDFTVEVDKEYRWLVKRGDLSFRLMGDVLIMRIDPKGQKSCLLTVQDALDIYSILSQFGQYMHDRSDKQTGYQPRIATDSKNAFSWNIGKDKLRIYLNEESEYLQVSYSGRQEIPLDIGLISETAQAIGIILRNAAEK